MRDMVSGLDMAQSIAPAVIKTSTNGSGVDLANCDGATVLFDVGTITDGTHSPKIQESSDNSTFTDVDSDDLIGSLSDLDDDTLQTVGYIGSKRYIRAVVTVSGSPSTGGAYGAVVIRGHLRKQPAS